MTQPKPPRGLSAEARRWWRLVSSEYGIDDPAGRLTLQAACEAFQRMREAQTLLLQEGLTTIDRFGQSKVHPAVLIERDSRAAMLQALKALRLEMIEPPKPPGRPPGVPARK